MGLGVMRNMQAHEAGEVVRRNAEAAAATATAALSAATTPEAKQAAQAILAQPIPPSVPVRCPPRFSRLAFLLCNALVLMTWQSFVVG